MRLAGPPTNGIPRGRRFGAIDKALKGKKVYKGMMNGAENPVMNTSDLPPLPQNAEDQKTHPSTVYESYEGELFEKPEPCEKLAYTSKILGFLSIVLCWIPYLGIIFSAFGLIFAIIAKSKKCKKYCVAGIVFCAFGLLFSIIGTKAILNVFNSIP